MLDFLMLGVFILFAVGGFAKPHIAMMGYVWVDIVSPQTMSPGFMYGQPLSMLMAIVCLGAIGIRLSILSKIKSFFLMFLLGIWALWITYTTTNAFFQEVAWFKWDWAFKTIVFSMLLPFVFKGWGQLDDLLFSIVLSFSYITLSAGLKGMAGGGGYGMDLVHGLGNTMTESSTMTCIAIMLIPYIRYLARYSSVLERWRRRKDVLCWGLIIIHLFTLIASQARTGFLALVTYLSLVFMKSRRKVLFIFLIFTGGSVLFVFTPQSYFDRMDTMLSVEEDGSAYGRIVVWKWTWDMVKEYPNGGGFGAYRANEGKLMAYSEGYQGGGGFSTAKAFHSIYFETLGEQGYFGCLIFIALLITSLAKLKLLRKKAKSNREVAIIDATWQAIVIFCVGGAFVGIAYQPIVYFLFAIVLLIEKNHFDAHGEQVNV